MPNGPFADHISYAFRHILELAKMPDQITDEVVFNQKTIQEAAETFGADPYDEYWAEMDDMYAGDSKDVLPDAVDQAIYQTENPNAIMTPWGPALDPLDTESIMDTYFGADSLVGLDPEETQELFKEADAIIDNSGDALEEIINQAELTSMSENLDPNEVAQGVADQMAMQISPDADVPIDDGLPWWETSPLSPLNWFGGVAEASDDPEVPDPLDAVDDGPGLLGQFGKTIGTSAAGLVGSLSNIMFSGDTDVAQADMEFLNNLLDLPDEEILSEISEALQEGRLLGTSVESWVKSLPDGSAKYALGQDALALTLEEEKATPTTSKNASWEDVASVADETDIMAGFNTDNLRKVFYQQFGTRPGAGRYEIRSQMDNIFADSLTLFHLFGGEENFQDSWSKNWQDHQASIPDTEDAVADTGPLEGAYNKFLNRYMADPYGTRSGPQFDAAVSEVGRLLNVYENQILPEDYDIEDVKNNVDIPGIAKEDAQRLPWVVGMFGEGRGDAARRNLAHLYRTGGSKSYYAQQIHSVMDEMWDYWSAIGMSEADIFQRMTAPGEKMDPATLAAKTTTGVLDTDVLGAKGSVETAEDFIPWYQKQDVTAEDYAVAMEQI